MHAAILIKNQLKANVGKRHSKTVPVHLKGVEIKIDNYNYMSSYDKINKKIHTLESESIIFYLFTEHSLQFGHRVHMLTVFQVV